MELRLKRNLRRDILRGDPWIYREALQSPERGHESSSLAKLLDSKGKFLAWVLFDSNSVLAARVISTQVARPKPASMAQAMQAAWSLRKDLLDLGQTTGFRLFNGEGDRLPGLVVDVYGATAVLQFDGNGPAQFWDSEPISQWLIENLPLKTVVVKQRRGGQAGIDLLRGTMSSPEVEFLENGVKFVTNLEKGQKTGFFLDQRDNRQYLRTLSKGKSLLNLFSYTGGFSIYAGMGDAKQVISADISQGALEMSERSWVMNGLPSERHQILCVDIYEYLEEKSQWDVVVVDPPSMAHSEKHKESAVEKYVEVFSRSAQTVRPRGDLVMSSCSSHITSDDFEEIIRQSLSRARRTGRVVRISGQGGDHPFPHVNQKMRYLKFVHLRLDQ